MAALKTWAVQQVRRAEPTKTAEAIRRLKCVNGRAMLRYRATPYSGQVLLLRSREETALERQRKELLRWDRLIHDGLHVRQTAGSHWTLMDEPQVAETAAALDHYLQKAQAGRWADAVGA